MKRTNKKKIDKKRKIFTLYYANAVGNFYPMQLSYKETRHVFQKIVAQKSIVRKYHTMQIGYRIRFNSNN